MFGLSLPEIIVIMVLALVLFGPDKLPEVARSMGKFMGNLRKGSDQIRREFYQEVYRPLEDVKVNLINISDKHENCSNCESTNKPAETEAGQQANTPNSDAPKTET